jgi:hypothetical protein
MAAASLMLSLAQLIATDAMRGRVMSVYNLAFRAGMPLGALALGNHSCRWNLCRIVWCWIDPSRGITLLPDR